MAEKMKRILSVFYVIFFAPFCVNFLFPLVQLYFLGKDRNYYLLSAVSASNIILVILSIVVFFAAMLVGDTGRTYEIFYYFLGLFIGILCKNGYQGIFGMVFLYENLLYGIFAAGYLFVILCIAVEAVWGKKSRTVKEKVKV